MTDPRVHDADPGVHDGVIFAFTMDRSGRSRWTETRTLAKNRNPGPRKSGTYGSKGVRYLFSGHRHPQEGAEEVIHQRIRLHHLPAQTPPREESKPRSKEIRHLRLERCPVPFLAAGP